MTRAIVGLFLILTLFAAGFAESDNPFLSQPLKKGYVLRSHPIEPTAVKSILPDDPELSIPEWFNERYQLELPEGTYIVLEPGTATLIAATSKEGHVAILKLLHEQGVRPIQLEVSLRLVRFDSVVLDKLDRRSSGGLSDADIIGLWRKGHGETLSSSSLVTESGVNATVESVEGILYPVEAINVRKEQPEIPFFLLDNHQTSSILTITPARWSGEGSVHLSLVPKHCVLKKRETEAKASNATGPATVESLELFSNLILSPGHIRIAGSSSSQDGKSRIYMLVYVNILTNTGKLVPVKKAPEKEEK